jgi:hypothetical protein
MSEQFRISYNEEFRDLCRTLKFRGYEGLVRMRVIRNELIILVGKSRGKQLLEN